MSRVREIIKYQALEISGDLLFLTESLGITP